MIQKTMLAVIVGTVLAAWSPYLPGVYWLVGLTAVGLLVLRVSVPITGLVLGFVWCALAGHQMLADRWGPEESQRSDLVHGEVVGLPTWSGDSLRFDFRPTRHSKDLPKLVRVYWYRAKVHVSPGEQWALRLRLHPPKGRLNFSGFDYEHYLVEQGIGAIAQVHVGEPDEAARYLGINNGLFSWFDRQRLRLAENIQARTVDLEVAAIKRALLVGDRSGLEEGTRLMMQHTGTAHLLAISGLHVGMVAGFGGVLAMGLWWVISLLGMRFNRRGVVLMVGWVCAFFYTGLAGFSIPTQRALVMLAVAVVALMWRRRIQPFDGLLVAATLVVLWHPLSVLSAGFWLSFAAVAYLIWGFAWRMGPLQRWRAGRALIRAQWLVSLGLVPLSLTVFGQWSVSSFLANAVAIPWVSALVLPGLLTSTLAEEISLVLPLVGQLTDQALALLLLALGWIQAHLSLFITGQPSKMVVTVLGLWGAWWLLGPSGWPARWMGGLLMLPLITFPKVAANTADLTMEVLDVGGGLAVSVGIDQYRFLYDVGPSRDDDRTPIAELINDWPMDTQATGSVRMIDDLVLSHRHGQHVGGMKSLSGLVWARRLRYSAWIEHPESVSAGEFITCARGQQWSVAQWHFEVLHPGPFLPDLAGNSSCVVRIVNDQHSILLAGGLDLHGESHLLMAYPDLKADVLIVANSGHRQSTSETWLQTLNPSWALISVSAKDRFGRPDDGVLRRLQARDIKTLTTAECGALRLAFSATSPELVVTTAVGDRPRFWRLRGPC